MPGVVEQQPDSYPKELESRFVNRAGQTVHIRPILPRDAPLLQKLFRSLSAESIYRRFFMMRRELTDSEARSLATLDYKEALALVALPDSDPNSLIGVARMAPIAERAHAVEMAIVVRDDYQKLGIGRALLERLIQATQQRNIRWILMETQTDNQAMINLVRATGYHTEFVRDGSALRIWLDLTETR